MGTVHKLRPDAGAVTLAGAVAAFLATLDRDETAGTHRVYAGICKAMTAGLGGGVPLADLTPAAVAAWFTTQWGKSKPATWDSRRGAVRGLFNYCEHQGWIPSAADLMRGVPHRRVPANRDRALSHAQVQELLTREGIPLRERLLWRMLYETAARASEILGLDVADLDMPNRLARVRRKGGARDIVVWQTGTARLLPRYLKGRTAGPVFLTERRARVELLPGDIDPESGRARLSYDQAQQLFKAATDGCTLHQLRHSALTHDAETGTGTPMLMARSGHTSVTSLVKYARVSTEALRRHMAETDPARRKR